MLVIIMFYTLLSQGRYKTGLCSKDLSCDIIFGAISDLAKIQFLFHLCSVLYTCNLLFNFFNTVR